MQNVCGVIYEKRPLLKHLKNGFAAIYTYVHGYTAYLYIKLFFVMF